MIVIKQILDYSDNNNQTTSSLPEYDLKMQKKNFVIRFTLTC